MCAYSWMVVLKRSSVSRASPMQVIIGYSIPPQPVMPSIVVICGYGYGQRSRERYSMEKRP